MKDTEDLELKKTDSEDNKEDQSTEDIKASDIDWNRVVGLWV